MKKIFMMLTALSIMGCSDSMPTNGEMQSSTKAKSGGVNVITSSIVSDPANDPYSIENMSKAMRKQILAKSAADSQEVEQLTLEPNYLHVRFLAEGKRGVAELKAYDTSLVLFKHPLDYKRIPKPVIYKDPTLPDSIIPMFATVPVDYKFGPTKYDVVKELFLIEPLDDDCEDDDCSDDVDSTMAVRALAKKAAEKSNGTLLEKLNDMGISLRDVEWESLSMTGNLDDRLGKTKIRSDEGPVLAWSLFGGGRKLGGHLTFEDDLLGVQPLVGVRVTGGYSYYWREAHTDNNGYFKIPEKWTFSIDYEANFDADDFLLEDGHSGYGEDLEIEHNNYKSDWKETFTGDKAKWCVVWTAAYQYWYGDNFGLKRPRQNTATNWSLDIEVYYKNDKDYKSLVSKDALIGCNAGNSVGQYANLGIFENICILAYRRSSQDIFGTTVHEVAHSSHYWNMKTTNAALPQAAEFALLDTDYRETYARGIQNYFIKERYNNDSLDYRVHSGGKDKYTYTDLVEDLYDNDNSSRCDKISDEKKRDKVSGFPITSIETAFFQNKKFSTMKSYLMKKNASGKNGVKYTSTDMDNLFKCWGL